MSDEDRSTEPVHVEVVGRQFRHDGEEYLHGAELEVPEWVLDGYPGRIQPVAEPEPETEPEPEEGDGDDGTEPLDPHPQDLNIDELEKRVGDVTDADLLERIRKAEKESDDPRTGAVEVLDDRLDELEG